MGNHPSSCWLLLSWATRARSVQVDIHHSNEVIRRVDIHIHHSEDKSSFCSRESSTRGYGSPHPSEAPRLSLHSRLVSSAQSNLHIGICRLRGPVHDRQSLRLTRILRVRRHRSYPSFFLSNFFNFFILFFIFASFFPRTALRCPFAIAEVDVSL